jgi:segregation and condensation protein A
LLLTLARAHEVDLHRIRLPDLLDQLTVALQQSAPLGQKADWVIMAAWLLQLRARLLLPSDTPGQQVAETEADRLRGQLLELQRMQVLAAWLEQRPQLGRDVFARGRPELVGTVIEAEPEIDVIEFLWASLALFEERDADAEAAEVYRPMRLDLHSVPEARERILRRLDEAPGAQPLERLLPEEADPDGDGSVPSGVRRRSGWTSSFAACLELAKQGEVELEQAGAFARIMLRGAEPGSTMPAA